jgi:hypothetical protein
LTVTNPGKVFWVNNSSVVAPGGLGGSNNGPGTYQKPFQTIEGALNNGAVKASRGDVLMVMPGHAETITTDGGIALDKAGVAVVGMGSGTLRPVIILDTAAAAAVTVTAANCSMQNFEFRASFADVTNALDVTAAWFALDNCEFTEEGANLNFVDYIACSGAANTADGLSVTNCVGTAIDAAQNSFLNITDDLDRLVFNDNFYSSSHANTLAAILCATGKDLTDCQVLRNYINSVGKITGDLLIDNDTTANTGIVAHNRIGHADTAGEILVDADGVRQFDNLGTATNTASGYVLPAIDS